MRRLLLLIICLITFARCTTTEGIPEGEQLYLGIKGINYASQRTKSPASEPETGVITSIADAYGTVHGLIEGTMSAGSDLHQLAAKPKSMLTSEEKKALKIHQEAEAAALAAAREEIDAALAYEPNGSLFGSSKYTSPWKFGLWTYNRYATSESRFGKWMFRKFGEPPILISTVAPQTRAKIATNTLHNFGYFRGKVDYQIVEGKSPRSARLQYDVTMGPVFHLDSVEYRSFGATTDSLLAASTSERLLKSGEAFSVLNLVGEQSRIESIMREHGYYYWLPGFVSFQADTISVPGHVQMRILPKAGIPVEATHPWYVGNTHINIRNRQNAPLDHERQSRRGGYTYAWNGEKMPAKARVWRGAINHRKGQPFRLSDQNSTLSKLAALGILDAMDVSYAPRDTAATCDTLDVFVNVVMGKPYDSSFEVNTTLKSSQQLGPGVRYELAKRNAFRGGETVAWDAFGSYEWQLGRRNNQSGILNSFELGSSLSITLPRFAFPFLAQRRLRFPATTKFDLSVDWRNRSGYFQMLDFGAGITYNWTKKSLRHQWDMLDIDYYRLINTTATFDAIMHENPAIYASMRNIFVPSMAYTLTYAPTKRSSNLWAQWSVKSSGNIVDGLHHVFYPHQPADQPRTILGSRFAQFIKTTAEVHYTFPINQRMWLATRGVAGIIYDYGSGEGAPYAEQFYIGGAGSIRAFTVRTAGPGGYRTSNSKYAYIDQTGNFRLEANAELRARLIGNLHSAVFLDAGNVWLTRRDEQRPQAELTLHNLRRIALGTGIGLRYDLDFLILRFDVGIGLHAPYDTSRKGFYNFERFRDGIAYHFAIGYPF